MDEVNRISNVRQRELGRLLKQLRRAAGLHLSHIGELLGQSESKVCRVEYGTAQISAAEALLVAGYCRATARQIHEVRSFFTHPDLWVRRHTDGTAMVNSMAAAELEAQSLVCHAPWTVPELLQTDTYTSTLLTFTGHPDGVKGLSPLLAARKSRKKRMVDSFRGTMHFFIHEQTLTSTVGNHDVMRDQVAQLLNPDFGRRRCFIRIVEKRHGAAGLWEAGFTLLDYDKHPTVAHTTVPSGVVFDEDPDSLASLQLTASMLKQTALSVVDSHDWLTRALHTV
ncbi:helix-turn-helix domain-containing protein [Amycolatopsis nigrescens]|uniref:helix-turn-helix domain-containing protein n=1 Tax=Amycolatopsis nigrescens TaxID=381445 RepID=UPI00039E14CE|nr:helix-turn-helix transcriptional regulator [Amycolatopsis nigrescens]